MGRNVGGDGTEGEKGGLAKSIVVGEDTAGALVNAGNCKDAAMTSATNRFSGDGCCC